MDTPRLGFFIFIVITATASSASLKTTESQCMDLNTDSFRLFEGEAFRFVPHELGNNVPDDEVTWYKNNSQINITTDENQNVHYHGGALFFLNLCSENSGLYIARQEEPSGRCYNYFLQVDVFKRSNPMEKKFLYGSIEDSAVAKQIPCPDPVHNTCTSLAGTFSWSTQPPLPELQTFTSPEDRQKADLWIKTDTDAHNGIYTCTCTWKHNNKEYKSTASREVKHQEIEVHVPVEIISPTNKEQLADEGAGMKLNCSVYCGINVKSHCKSTWEVNGVSVQERDGYRQTSKVNLESPSQTTISTATLVIDRVSAEDFKTEFKCIGVGLSTNNFTIITLKRRESIIPLVSGGVCVLLFGVFAAMLVKCFAIDLALFFRRCIPLSSYKKDMRMYDAYVVYQMQSMDKDTEDALCQFISKILPSVLEEKCGYRLFIHGRDDIPGEDRLELVEDCMKQSKRLMVILTPGSGSELENADGPPASPQTSVIGGFDWQLGLHHALVQREMSVILIQLGDTGPKGYTHLPAGLQHLIQKSAPIRWPEGSRGATAWNSRFWKRVRYLMPATPAKKCLQSGII
ncbi:interleukin-1 receptor type 1 [Epinephelus lanceolatus]